MAWPRHKSKKNTIIYERTIPTFSWGSPSDRCDLVLVALLLALKAPEQIQKTNTCEFK